MELPNFKCKKITVSEMMELKGGQVNVDDTAVSLDNLLDSSVGLVEGTTRSTRTYTNCTGTDSDGRRVDSD